MLRSINASRIGIVGALLLALYLGTLIRHSTAAAGGADSSGYLNVSKLILRGNTTIARTELRSIPGVSPRRYAHEPLGFVSRDDGALAPYYPTGYPLLIAGLVRMTGEWSSAGLVNPLLSAASLILVYLVGRKLGLAPLGAGLGAAIVGLFPAWIMQSIQPMSDVPATFWILATTLFALSSRERDTSAVAAGFAFSMAVATRPTNMLFLFPLAILLPLSLRTMGLFVLGAAPVGVYLGIWNHLAYGNPFSTGYVGAGHDFALEFFSERVRHYLRWLTRPSSILMVAGLLALPFDQDTSRRTKGLLLSWFLVFFLFYCFYRHYDAWWYTRFLLPALPAASISSMLLIERLVQAVRPERRKLLVAFALLLVTGTLLNELDFLRERRVLELRHQEEAYPQVLRLAKSSFDVDAVVLTMQLSGSNAFYESLTSLRWDHLSPEEIATLHDQNERGAISLYAVLFPFEVDEARKRVGGRWDQIGEYSGISLWQIGPDSMTHTRDP